MRVEGEAIWMERKTEEEQEVERHEEEGGRVEECEGAGDWRKYDW